MFKKRSSLKNNCRLRVEVLEDRAVPAFVTGAINSAVDPSQTDPTSTGAIVASTALDGNPPAPTVDLAAFATLDRLKPSIGDIVTVRVIVGNKSADPGTAVKVAATLPDGLSFVSAKPARGTYDDATGIWSVGTVFPGGPVSLFIKAKVTDSAAQEINASIASADQADPNPDNDSATATVTPVLAKLAVKESASAVKLTTGAVVVFTVTVKNSGPGTAHNFAVGNVLGPGLKFVRIQAINRGSFSAKTGIWTVPTLGSGAVATLKIAAIVGSTGQLHSVATLSGGTGIDADASTFTATGTVTGTTVNTPATWSYSLPGFNAGPAPKPVTAGPSVAKPLVLPPGGLQLAQVLKLIRPSL